MKKGTIIRLISFLVCMFTVLFTITAHGTMTGKRIILFLIVTIIGSALLILLDKWCDKGADIEKLLSLKLKNGRALVDVIACIIVVLLALFVRISFFSFETEDSIGYFAGWVEQFRWLGVKTSLGACLTDYSPLYTTILTLLSLLPFKALTIVKIVPVICDFLIALAAVLIYNACKGKEATTVGRICILFFTLLNPISVLNSAAWGQCDSAYAVSLFFGIYFLSKVKTEGGKYSDLAVLMFALSFATKLQAIFTLPVLLFFYVAQRKKEADKAIRLSQFVWFPVVYFASSIPMFLCGKTLENIFMVYVEETGEYNTSLNMRYPNFYTLVGDKVSDMVNHDGSFMFGLVTGVMVLFLFYYLFYKKELSLDLKNLLLITAITVLTLNYFLPSMHERYAYVGEIALLIFAYIYKKHILATVFTFVCTLTFYADYLTLGALSSTIPKYLVAIVRLIVLIYLITSCLGEKKENKDLQIL